MPLAFNPITAEFDYTSPDLTLNALRVKGGGGTSYSGYPAAFAVETDSNLYWQLVIADNTATTDHFGIYGFINGVFGFQSEQYLTTGTSCTLSPEGIIAESNSRGTGAVPGKMVWAGRNMSGGGAAGVLGLYSKSGGAKYFWFDNSGNPRMHSARPTENGSVSDTAGVQLATLVAPTFTAPVILNEAVGSSALTINGATQTASFPALNITQTWNNASIPFEGVKIAITNTASRADANILALYADAAGTTKVLEFRASPTSGQIISNGNGSKSNVVYSMGNSTGWGMFAGASGGVQFAWGGSSTPLMYTTGVIAASNHGFQWSSAANDPSTTVDLSVWRDAANTLAQRNSTAAQTFRLYNTWTNASNGEWATFNWSSNVLHIGATKNGTGTARSMQLDYGGTTTAAISIPITSGAVTFGGGIALSAANFATDTTTGTKFGTATGQKLGFWNATPIVQPTTAIAAATFVANTSLIANDTATFDGYTIGQIVKALRNAGLLA